MIEKLPTFNTDFTDKQSYLLFRKQWKDRYMRLSELIRALRKIGRTKDSCFMRGKGQHHGYQQCPVTRVWELKPPTFVYPYFQSEWDELTKNLEALKPYLVDEMLQKLKMCNDYPSLWVLRRRANLMMELLEEMKVKSNEARKAKLVRATGIEPA